MQRHNIVEVIRFLQSGTSISQDDLFKIEWNYLPLLDDYSGATPKTLENKLASDPEFFCEVIKLIYRSSNSNESQQEQTEIFEFKATNAWNLLHHWKIIPGIPAYGQFNVDRFSMWFQRVKELCSESGHLEVALVTIGEILVHSPVDPDGLWINRTICKVLNDRDNEKMRDGYRSGCINSRGAHFVDTTGQDEMRLAEQFRKKAEDIDNAGFPRLANTLRDMSKFYERNAERVKSQFIDWEEVNA
jgi:hypothetical protein